MLYLTIFYTVMNCIFIVALLCYIIHKNWYIYLDRLFWTERIYGLDLMRRTNDHSAYGVLHIRLGNYDKLCAWDEARFHDGTYEKYRKAKKGA
jgi:hypothetical protein